MDYAVEITKLTKVYKKIKALDEVSLAVPPGKIYGLIGPNGAGKTTLIRSIIGTTKPTSGTISVMGIDPVSDRYALRKLVGYMPQDPSLYEDLTARGNVAFFANAAGVKNAGKRITEVLELVELSHRSINSVHTFSGGMKKRVSLACALVHSPQILFLDEPTSAIDPKLKQKLWQLFRKLASNGTTLFISTNMIEEAMYCDQVAILREGKLLLVASPEKLKKKGSTSINITFKDGKILKEKIANNPEEIAKLLKRHGLKSDVETVEIAPDSLDKILLNLIGNEK